MEELLETGRVNRVGTASLSVLRRGASTHSCSIKAPCLELWGGSPFHSFVPGGAQRNGLGPAGLQSAGLSLLGVCQHLW